MKLLAHALLFLLAGLGYTSAASAQAFGKIRGEVVDAETGETLIGANVLVDGTSHGAAADLNGVYNILQVPAGEHTLVASFVGYQTKRIQGVEVKPDLTTNIDVELMPATVQGDEVIVTAERSMVQPDITHTRTSVTREEMESTPGMTSTMDIFKAQGGTVIEGPPQRLNLGGTEMQIRDESLQEIHIRGGRGGEVLYLVDGVPITHPLYGGRSVLDIDVSNIESIEILSGAFNAEYGNAQSAVVKITTRAGQSEYNVGGRYQTDDFGFAGHSSGTHYMTLYASGPDPLFEQVLRPLGLDLPGRVFFYGSGTVDMSNTDYNNNRERERFSLLGLDVTGRQQNSFGLNGKMTWRVNPTLRIELNYNGSLNRWSSYSWAWKNNANNTPTYMRNSHNLAMQVRHSLSDRTFYEGQVSFLGNVYRGNFEGMTPEDFWVFFKDSTGATRARSAIIPPQRDQLTGFYNDTGFQSPWRDDQTTSLYAKGKITSQVHSNHLVTAGIEGRLNRLEYVDIQDGAYALSPYGEFLFNDGEPFDRPPGPFPEFGQNRWVFDANTLEGGIYLEDKFELATFILNAGARLDVFSPGPSVMNESFKEAWEDATGLAAKWDQFHFNFSPRLGVSFPISETTMLFFSYGHFAQMPEATTLLRDPYTGGFTGNPGLDFERSITYEFGFTRQLAETWLFDIKTYNRDFSQQVGTTTLQANLGLPVALYDNVGYSRARGIELKFTNRSRYESFTSGEATYTVQWAKGYSSSSFEDYIYSQNDMPKPIRERRLSYDVRHQVILQGQLKSPDTRPFRPFGISMGKDWFLTAFLRFSSGNPFTPGVIDPVEAQRLYNIETGPYTTQTDLKFRKRFNISGGKVGLELEVFNLFDNRNVNIGRGFNVWTGLPYLYGDIAAPLTQIYSWHDMFFLQDPQQFSLGRRFRVGLEFDL